MNWFETVASSICYALASDISPEHPILKPPYNDIAAFILRQLSRTAIYIRIPLVILTLFLDLMVLFASGRMLHQMNQDQRRKTLQVFRASRLSVLRDFVRFYESLVMLAIWSRSCESLTEDA